MATPELLTCPDIYQLARRHHGIIHLNTTRVLSIVTPLEKPPGDVRAITIDHDPHMVTLDNVDVLYEHGLLYITLALRAVDVGVCDIGLTIPEATTSPLSVAHTLQTKERAHDVGQNSSRTTNQHYLG